MKKKMESRRKLSVIISCVLGTSISSCSNFGEIINVRYISNDETMGSIEGNTNQNILFFGNTFEVRAVPKEHYEFDRWSDGVLTPYRSDKQLQPYVTNYTYCAIFKPEKYNVTFATTDSNISLISGKAYQEVYYGGDTESVECIIKDQYSSVFSGWRIEGDPKIYLDNPLTIKNVTQNLAITAQVYNYVSVKYDFYIGPDMSDLRKNITFDGVGLNYFETFKPGNRTTKEIRVIIKPTCTKYRFEGWYSNTTLSLKGALLLTTDWTLTPTMIGQVYKSMYVFPYFSVIK